MHTFQRVRDILDKLCLQPWPGEGESEAGSIVKPFSFSGGWVIDSCSRIQGKATFNEAFTKGLTTKNVFMIASFILLSIDNSNFIYLFTMRLLFPL